MDAKLCLARPPCDGTYADHAYLAMGYKLIQWCPGVAYLEIDLYSSKAGQRKDYIFLLGISLPSWLCYHYFSMVKITHAGLHCTLQAFDSLQGFRDVVDRVFWTFIPNPQMFSPFPLVQKQYPSYVSGSYLPIFATLFVVVSMLDGVKFGIKVPCAGVLVGLAIVDSKYLGGISGQEELQPLLGLLRSTSAAVIEPSAVLGTIHPDNNCIV